MIVRKIIDRLRKKFVCRTNEAQGRPGKANREAKRDFAYHVTNSDRVVKVTL